jgi:competence protein ComEC
MLIDGGNAADSDLIYSFLENHGIANLNYIVATHAHEDHVGGLAGALNYATAATALSPVAEYNSRAFKSFVKYLEDQNVSLTVPKHGDKFKLGSADVEIVGPINPTDEPNNTSIVMRIVYGGTSFLFTGDAERGEEQDILEAGYGLSATVLKVGHHGSDTSTTYPFLREIMPKYAVISCGKDNSYGHPHDNLLSRLRDADATVYRTDMQGTITCTSDGKNIYFTTERNVNVQTNPAMPSEEESYYIGNKNSKKYHRPTCTGLPLEKNRTLFDSREAAIDAGYEPCGICLRD